MRTSTVLSALAAATMAAAQQRPDNTSMCDYYSMALFNSTNATSQYTLLTALVNTAVIGNYSNSSKSAVTGILNNGTFNGQQVSLLKYFDGMLASTNRDDKPVSVSFLDGGGADPLKMNKPANDTMSNQYFLLTHLYSYFGALLNCSTYGKDGFPAYSGDGSQYAVHKYMDLTHEEVGYFIQEVGLAAASFGVTEADVTAVGTKLGNVFNYKCAPNATVIPAQGPQAQSICVAESCPLAPEGMCSGVYQAAAVEPQAKNDTNMFTSKPTAGPTATTGGGSSGGDASDTAAASASGTNAASAKGVGAAVMGVAGLFAIAAGL